MFAPIQNNETNDDQNVRNRRALFLRGVLIMALLFLLLDGNDRTTTSTNLIKKKQPDEIKLRPQHSQFISNVLATSFSSTTHKQNVIRSLNVSALYRGSWLVDNITDHTVLSASSGVVLLRTKSVRVRQVQDLEFVFGILKSYTGKEGSIWRETMHPVQGVYMNSNRKLLLFSTPRREQRIYLQLFGKTLNSTQLSNNTTNSGSSDNANSIIHTDSSSHAITSTDNNSSLARIRNRNRHRRQHRHLSSSSTSTSGSGSDSDSDNDLIHYLTPRDNIEGRLAVVVANVINVNHSSSNSSNSSNSHNTILNSTSNGVLFGHDSGDSYRYPLLVSIELGESFLSPDFKSVQKLSVQLPQPPPYGMNGTSLVSTAWSNKGSNNQSLSDIATVNEKKSGGGAESVIFSPKCEYVYEVTVEEDTHHVSSSSENSDVYDSTVPYAGKIHGTAVGITPTCSNQPSITLTGSTYVAELLALAFKVDMYAVIMCLATVIQIALCVLQLRHSNTSAASSKLSLSCIFAQAILGAVMCMLHLLLGMTMNQFFWRFAWVALLHMIVFSFFLMRLGINSYQAQYAQELALEGTMGFRRRLVTLHMKFYAVLFAVLLFAMAFPTRPYLGIACLYSFWIPQIIYSAYSGTKHSYLLVYIVGMSLTYLFVPLYVLWCPHTFYPLIMTYLNPSAPPLHITNYLAGSFAVLWVGIQVGVLYLQKRYGPRFFVPISFLPTKYDYHRAIPANLLRSDSGDDTTAEVEEDRQGLLMTSRSLHSRNSVVDDIETGSSHSLECVICCNPISLLPEAQHNQEMSYMITPCDHVFHSRCLTQWTAVKMECPVCRTQLPDIDNDDNDDAAGEESDDTA